MNTQSRHLNSFLLQGVLEGFIDGILIITAQGELVHSNERAQQICQQLAKAKEDSQPRFVPKAIWQVCQAVLESNQMYREQTVIVESEIKLEDCNADSTFRVRARWLELDDFQPCVLVTLEDQTQSLHNMVFTEVAQYSLTPREQDVWLLRRAEYTYKDIASELCITINTVKKHLKNIRAKIDSTQLTHPVGTTQKMILSSVS
jgi:RNA polymerase sigma factor (sigma-70 family)